jgi:hypothetical protein
MKRFLASLALGGLLLGRSTASHALSYTIKSLTLTADFTSNSGNFKETYRPHLTSSTLLLRSSASAPRVLPRHGTAGLPLRRDTADCAELAGSAIEDS